MPLLSLANIGKSFGSTRAVNDVSLDVNKGEFFGPLGPSGCGKTTTLRMIAGLELPDSGTVQFENENITNLPPERRGFGMVFQNYALFPHLNVFENVAFGLRARHKSKAQIEERVNGALELVQRPGDGKRRVDKNFPVDNSNVWPSRVRLRLNPRCSGLTSHYLILMYRCARKPEALREARHAARTDCGLRTHDQEEALLCATVSA